MIMMMYSILFDALSCDMSTNETKTFVAFAMIAFEWTNTWSEANTQN